MATGLYGTPPPLEYHMMIDSTYRIERALQLMVPGQVIEGYVIIITSYGLGVELNTLTIAAPVAREIADLRLEGLVKLENLARDPVKGKSALEDYQVDDVIRAVVLGVEGKIIQLSFLSESEDLKLGYIDEHLSSCPRLPRPTDYIDILTSSTGFKNPSSIDNLKHVLGVPAGSHVSLLRPILMTSIKEHEYYDSLRKSQRSNWSMNMVCDGVTCFKLYRYDEALKLFDYSLEIDAQNVEALVARGALYANKGHYKKAITDFEKALTINHTHSNAKKYLVETQTAYGRELERQGDMKAALRSYREALADNQTSEPARTRAALLTAVLEKQAAEQREKDKKKRDEENRLKKLQKIIERDHHHKKHKRKSKKRTSTKRYDSSSSSDSPQPHRQTD